MKEPVDVAVVGAGVTGLSVAYNLARLGMPRISVFERGYLGVGSTGRSGGGIRAQFASPEIIILARESERAYEKLSAELGYNVMFRQGGYLFLAYDEDEVRQYKEMVRLQNSLGVKSQFLEPHEAKELVPDLNSDAILGATFHGRDGTAVHQGVLWGYARACARLGVEVLTFTEVRAVRSDGDGKFVLCTDRGNVVSRNIVVAAGAHSKPIAKMMGVDIPTTPLRREALATEPLKPFFDPMIVSLRGEWLFQTLRGEVVGGAVVEGERPTYELTSTFDFLIQTARSWTRIMPRLKHVNILRQWAGLYDDTPDAKPILGETPVKGFYLACGFSGYGFMLAPMVGKLLAEQIVDGRTSIDIRPFSLERFRTRRVERERSLI